MPDDPCLTIPVLLGTIRAGRRSAPVACLLLGRLEGRDEVANAPINPADADPPVMRHRSGKTDAAPPGAVGLSKKLSRADALVIVAPEFKNGHPGSLKDAFD
jgi:NAD(P)H-dependent FMN reductase